MLHRDDVDDVARLKRDFEDGRVEPKKLFAQFEAIVGPESAPRHFWALAHSLADPRLTEQLMDLLQKALRQLRFRHNNLLASTRTYLDFFRRLSDEIAANLVDRVYARALSLKRRHQLPRERLFQLIGALQALDLREFFRLKYIGNFLVSVDSKQVLQRALFVPVGKVQLMLAKVDAQDLLLLSLYVNFGLSRFENDLNGVDPARVNPNLLKLFLRHYPKLADEVRFDLDSDPEDYDFKEPAEEARKHVLSAVAPKDRRDPGNDKRVSAVVGAKVSVFGQESSLIPMKFEFPALDTGFEQKGQAKAAKTKEPLLVYSNEAMKMKAFEEDFPELGQEDQGGQSVLARMGQKRGGQGTGGGLQAVVASRGVTEESGDKNDGGGRNIMEALCKNNSGSSNNVVIVKKQKKKK